MTRIRPGFPQPNPGVSTRTAGETVRPQATPTAAPVRNRPADVSHFEGASIAPRRPSLLPPMSPVAAPAIAGARVPAAESFPHPADVAAISAMTDPVARNYAITQGYHDLSNAMGGLLGTENASWVTFGAWASNTAGKSIRGEDVPNTVRDLLKKAEGPAKALAKVDDLLRKYGLPGLPVADLVPATNAALAELQDALGDGNREVFSIIGHDFSRFIETFGGDTAHDPAKVERFVQTLPQDDLMLREAFANYALAMHEKNPDLKAELILLANDQVGISEQTRLQGHIERAMNAPAEEAFRGVLEQSLDAVFKAGGFFGRLLQEGLRVSGALDRVVDGATNAFGDAFRKIATKAMMTMAIPHETLDLSDDLTAGPGGREFSDHLTDIQEPRLRELLAELDLTPNTLKGTAASDWAVYSDRMDFITDLFRSRQQDPQWFANPLGEGAGHYPQPETAAWS